MPHYEALFTIVGGGFKKCGIIISAIHITLMHFYAFITKLMRSGAGPLKRRNKGRGFFSFIFFLCSPRAMLSLDVVLKLYFAKLYKYGISITSKFFLKNCSIVESDKPFSKFSTCECKIHFLKRHLMLTFAKFKSFGHLFMHILRFKVGRNPKKCVCHLQGNCSGCLKC